MIQAMYSAVSGVQAHQTRLDVIGNNIANVNTVGYKSARVTFADQLSQTYRGATRPQGDRGGINNMQVGLGVRLGSITTQQTQGSLQQTGRPADLAIQGNGFFMVGDGQSAQFTRDGAFTLDSDGNLVSATTGMKLLGWPAASDGAIDTKAAVTPTSSIRIPAGTLTAVRASTKVDFGGNLDARAAVGDTYSRSARVYDSLGNAHDISFKFERADAVDPAAATWNFATSVDGGAFSAPGDPNSGTLSFDATGKLLAASGAVTFTPAGGASAVTLAPNFKDVSQLAGEYTANAVGQDGFPYGTLQSYAITEDGTVTGIFSNGLNRDLGKLAVAQFANPAGLEKVGSNLFRTSGNSGDAQISVAGVSGAGRISAGFLEQSNVNLADEFTNMIVTQRGFQANTRLVTASDELLQDLIQMKR